MDAAAAAHPTDQTLEAYASGRLEAASAASVDSHLGFCAECRQRVDELSADTFLGWLRDAHVHPESPAPVGPSFAGLSMTEGIPSALAAAPASSIPPGLAEHPDYEILGELGRGGMGVVYLAGNKLMGRMEVLKVVSRDLMDRRGILDRFLREIRNAAQLHHPNIVTAYSAIRAGESIVFAMEYVQGHDLAQLVKGNGPLPVAHACNFIYQAALGLQYAHEQGMVHRDIKPSNLILARHGKRPVVKVLDFGLAKATREGPLDKGLTDEGQMLGTPDYIAPEQSLDAHKADIRADIYGLGCTLYYVLSGRPPFQAASMYEVLQAHHSMEAKPLNLVRPEVPWELAAVVGKMMAKVPARRYQTPGEVARALKPFFKAVEAEPPVERTPQISQASQPSGDELVSRSRSNPAQPRVTLVPATPEPAAKQPLESTQAGSSRLERLEIPVGAPSRSNVTARAPTRVQSRPAWLWPAVAGGALLVGLMIAWDAGVFKAETKDGVILLENVPANAVVEVDGERVTVTPHEGKPVRIQVHPGKHGVVVKRDGVVLMGDSVSVEAGKEAKLSVGLEPLATAPTERDRNVSTAVAENITVLNDAANEPENAAFPNKVVLPTEPPVVGSTLPVPRAHITPSRPAQVPVGPRQATFLGDEPPLPSAAHDPSTLQFDRGRPMLVAPYCATSPVVDGIVQQGEYGNAHYVDFTFTPNSRFGALASGMSDPSQSKAPGDLSVRFRAAYSERSLFLAFQVRDQFVDDQDGDPGHPQWNDGVEIFLDGDRVANDFLFPKGGGIIGSSEGFQLLANSAGQQSTTARDFTNADWKTAAKRYNKGYVIEVEIPLALIDVQDGPGKVAAGPGSAINLGLAFSDNDVAVQNQMSYAFIRARPGVLPPIRGREDSWTFGIKLAPGPSAADRDARPEIAWQPLFNGRDLTGWSAHSSQPGNWQVKNGILIGSGPAASYLYTNRGDFKNLHLRVEARINDVSNSGVYLRAPFGPQLPTKKPALPMGYQGQMNCTPRNPNEIGSLFVAGEGTVVSVPKSPVRPFEWFTLEMIARGNRIIVKVNGRTTADYTDRKHRYASGHIVLQQQTPQTVVEFRKIEIKELK